MRLRARRIFALALFLLLSRVAPALEIGVVVPDFGMPTLDGKSFSLAESRKAHSAVVILFLSTICPYSNAYNDLIRDMATDFGKRGVAFVGVNSGRLETAEEVRVHARDHGHTFDVIKDPEGRIAELLDARRTPEAFLLDAEGRLRYRGRVASKISTPDLKNALEALLEGRPIRPAETKAFGCALPRRSAAE
jgi:peroxiredoxin